MISKSFRFISVIFLFLSYPSYAEFSELLHCSDVESFEANQLTVEENDSYYAIYFRNTNVNGRSIADLLRDLSEEPGEDMPWMFLVIPKRSCESVDDSLISCRTDRPVAVYFKNGWSVDELETFHSVSAIVSFDLERADITNLLGSETRTRSYQLVTLKISNQEVRRAPVHMRIASEYCR